MSETQAMIKRRNDLLIQCRNILALGFAYYVISGITGIYIPCVFRLATGYKCPGCGVTHMAIAMIHGNMHDAYMANQLLFILLPAAVIYGCYRAYRYVKSGKRDFSNIEIAVLLVTLLATIAFGICRNI